MTTDAKAFIKPDLQINGVRVIRDGLAEEWEGRRREGPPLRKSEEIFYQIMIDYYQRVLDVKKAGKYLVSHIFYCPTEILYAFDVLVPLSVEVTGDMSTAYAGLNVMEFRQIANSYGVPIEVCGAHAVPLGEAVSGVLPRPDMVIWSSQICDNTAKSGNDLARLFQVPGYLIDHPYRPSPKELAYHTQDLEGLVQFLEEHSGRKLSYDRLCQAVQHSRQVMETWKEINELKKATPFPSRSIDCFLNLMTYFLLAGSPEAVAYFEQSKAEIQARVEAGKGYLPAPERYRLMLLWTLPSFALPILDWIEQEYGAVIVMDPFSSWSAGGEMDPNRPMESIARRSFFTPGAHQQEGPMIEGIKDAVKNAQAYRVDGVINFAHLGCRQSCGIIRSLMDALKEQVGVPTVTLDCDFYDPTSITLDEIKEKLEGFFEILEGK